MVICSHFEPDAPAVKMVAMLVGAVSEASSVALASAEPLLTVAAKAGEVAMAALLC
jgi:hypothetical protein